MPDRKGKPMSYSFHRSPLVNQIQQVVIRTADVTLRTSGEVPIPQIHMFAEDMDQPYLGYIHTRPFNRGDDAAEAIAGLGTLPAALAATRVLVVWENRDVHTALQLPGSMPPLAVVAAEAGQFQHMVYWHPFSIKEIRPPSQDGLRGIVPEWTGTREHFNAGLPDPVTRALSEWRKSHGRQGSTDHLKTTVARLERSGYSINWIEPLPFRHYTSTNSIQQAVLKRT